jgi:hypothetical protein
MGVSYAKEPRVTWRENGAKRSIRTPMAPSAHTQVKGATSSENLEREFAVRLAAQSELQRRPVPQLEPQLAAVAHTLLPHGEARSVRRREAVGLARLGGEREATERVARRPHAAVGPLEFSAQTAALTDHSHAGDGRPERIDHDAADRPLADRGLEPERRERDEVVFQ